ncbi:MAG: peptidoglycan editing factor PgeF [Alphaproteobacteria bacterium]
MSIVCYTSDLLKKIPYVSHGFFGQAGGVSADPFASLNCARGMGDKDENVLENRRRAMAFLGNDRMPLVLAKQEHGIHVHVVEAPWPFDAPPCADSLVTRHSGIALGVLTADCGPILLADPTHNVIAACHAGWRGAFGGVIEASVEAMEKLGATRNSIVASLGPCIHQPFYEVDAEFYCRFEEKNASFSRFFQKSSKAEHFLFDLPGFILERFKNLGLEAVDPIRKDTYSGKFFSRRRAIHQGQQVYGCGISIIMLNSGEIF